jgi:hypothetical protein
MGIHIRYDSEEWLAAWQDPANYDILISSSTNLPPTDCTHTATITYTAGGAKPPYCFINFTSTAEAYIDVIDTPTSPYPASGTATADNGYSPTVTGAVAVDLLNPPQTVTDASTERIKVTLTSGVGTYNLNASVSGTITLPSPNYGLGVVGNFSLTGVFDPATLATVRVDNVSMQICYSVTTTGTEIQWSRAVFSPNGKNVAFRSSGELDVIEYDYRNSSFISGTNRDGGIAPPDWYFVTQQIQWDGAKARLASVQYHGQNATDLIQTSLSVDDGAYVNGALAGVNTSRWYGWHPSISSGIRHKIKFTGSETDSSLKGFALEFNTQSKGKPK